MTKSIKLTCSLLAGINRFTSAPQKAMINIDGTVLCCPVYKIPGFSEMRRLKAWILAFLPDGYQFFFEQRHHINGIFLRGWMEKDPADMGCHTKIHFILVFGLSMLYDCKIDESCSGQAFMSASSSRLSASCTSLSS